MTKRYCIILNIPLLIAFVILSGCSQTDVKQDLANQVRAVPYSIATSGDPDVDLHRASTYTWMPGMHEIHGTPSLRGVSVRNLLEAAINNAMTAKGYRFIPDAATNGLLVGYQVMLGDSTGDDRAEQRLGVNPGLTMTSPDATRYAQGTLVITVVDNQTGRTAWRSALQGFADLDIPANVRRQRINAIVTRMLAAFPARAQSKQ